MYSLTSSNRYYLYQGIVRMNLGIDGLFKIIHSEMKDLSPVSGDIFLFFGSNRQNVKILRWDGDGFLLYYKLSSDLFGQPVDFLYLNTMKKDDIIELLMDRSMGYGMTTRDSRSK